MRLILAVMLVSFMAVVILITPCFAKIDPEAAILIYLFEDEKAEEIEDHSERGNNGVMEGGAGKWVEGRFGLAIDARSGWVNVGNNDSLHPIDAWTIVAWFNAEDIAGDITNGIVCKWDEYLLRVDRSGAGNNLAVYVKPENNWEPRAKGGVPETETWIHAALVWDNEDNGALKVYKDGVMIVQQARPGKILAVENPLCIGSQTGGAIFQGLIDDVGIFSIALEEEDITLIMEEGLEAILDIWLPVEPRFALATTWGKLKLR